MSAGAEVAYIFPASLDLAAGNRVAPCAGALNEEGQVAHYTKIVGGWPSGPDGVELGYSFAGLTTKLGPSITQSEIIRAFREWEKYARLNFAPASDTKAPHTINVTFGRGSHGDPYPFDGSGKVLAHTFYPPPLHIEPFAGDIHFDDDENRQIGSYVDLFSVALHEATHALSLRHSDTPVQ